MKVQDINPNNKLLISYLASALTCLEKLVRTSNEPMHQLFFIASSLLSAQAIDYSSIINATLELIAVLLNHQPTITALRPKDQYPQHFKNLLSQLEKMYTSQASVKIIYEIISSLLINNLTHLLLNGRQGGAADLLLLFPLAELIGQNPRDVITKVKEFPPDFSELTLSNLRNGLPEIKTLVQDLGEMEIELIVNLLEHCISSNPAVSRYIFDFCREVIESKKKISASIFVNIATKASKDNRPENTGAALLFLKTLASIGTIPPQKPKEIFKKFPEIHFPDEFSTMKNILTDSKLLFEDPAMFPLLPIYDDSFLKCETAVKITQKMLAVKVWPIEEWEQMFIQAKEEFQKPPVSNDVSYIELASSIEALNEESLQKNQSMTSFVHPADEQNMNPDQLTLFSFIPQTNINDF